MILFTATRSPDHTQIDRHFEKAEHCSFARERVLRFLSGGMNVPHHLLKYDSLVYIIDIVKQYNVSASPQQLFTPHPRKESRPRFSRRRGVTLEPGFPTGLHWIASRRRLVRQAKLSAKGHTLNYRARV